MNRVTKKRACKRKTRQKGILKRTEIKRASYDRSEAMETTLMGFRGQIENDK